MNNQINRSREDFRKNILPKFYSPLLHIFISFGLPGLAAGYSIKHVDLTIMSSYLWAAFFFSYIELSVYLLHRYPMHNHFKTMSWVYNFHAKIHHSLFTDIQNNIDSLKDIYMILFPPSLVIFFVLIFYSLNAYLLAHIFGSNVGWVYYFISNIYFLLYECFHLAGHSREDSIIRKIPLINDMGIHHQNHHNHSKMNSVNFGIVTSIFDRIFKTNF